MPRFVKVASLWIDETEKNQTLEKSCTTDPTSTIPMLLTTHVRPCYVMFTRLSWVTLRQGTQMFVCLKDGKVSAFKERIGQM